MAVAEHYRIPHSQLLAWSKEDRDKAIWWHLRQRETHDRCGTRAEEWDPNQGGHRHARVARLHRCRGCEVMDAARESIPQHAGRGVYVTLVPNPALR